MKKESSYILDMQNVLPAWTATNWYSMFSSSTTNLHDIKSNFDKIPNKAPPTFFHYLSKNYPNYNSRSFYSWEPLGKLLNVDSKNHEKNYLSDEKSVEEVKSIIKSKILPDFSFYI